jgi:ketopantoate reductase
MNEATSGDHPVRKGIETEAERLKGKVVYHAKRTGVRLLDRLDTAIKDARAKLSESKA